VDLIEKIQTLHSLGISARIKASKPENEPRTILKYTSDGRCFIVFHSTSFTFIDKDQNFVVVPIDKIDWLIDQAKKELEVMDIVRTAKGNIDNFRDVPNCIPIVICTTKYKRLITVHIDRSPAMFKNRVRRDKSYISWQDLEEKHD
jgi:hypothetical protein